MRLNPGKLKSPLLDQMRALLIGQEPALTAVESAITLYNGGFAPKPVSSFLFLGPTGTGKTRTVEVLAKVLHGKESHHLKVDCAEFQHSHEIAKLLGSPPGYLGHRETSPFFTNAQLKGVTSHSCPLSLILFDEIEKASDAVWNLLLGILDKATLRLGDNTVVDFSQSLIFMTSNLGAEHLDPRPGMTFLGKDADAGLRDAETVARRNFKPEFWNRIEHKVTYAPLDEAAIGKIFSLEITRILRGDQAVPFEVSIRDSARTELIRRGVNKAYGARELNRVIRREVVLPLARIVAQDIVPTDGLVEISYRAGTFDFHLAAAAAAA